MKIAIIGTGNIGGALANGFVKAGHEILLGVRNVNDFKGKNLLGIKNISAYTISEASASADVILIAAVPQAVADIVKQLGNVQNKVIIDTMNSVRVKPEPFSNTTEAIQKLSGCKHVVKCFNCTGAENIANPIYNGKGIDMFVASDSAHAREIATQLSKDIGFNNIYNFGGSDKFNLLEQFALCWINLAMMQGYGRGIAFNLESRSF